MDYKLFTKRVKHIYRYLLVLFAALIIGAGGLIYKILNPSFLSFSEEKKTEPYTSVEEFDKIENDIHLATGFKNDEGLQLVIANCTSCHSAKLVTQNRATKEGWLGIIRWMQETQNLWDLGNNEAIIVDYLAKNYAPDKKGRRQALQQIEWYDLED